jgi:photosystem II stability/assembly factor-like uncharacterized protein
MKTSALLFTLLIVILAVLVSNLYAQMPFWQQTFSGNPLRAAVVNGLQFAPNGDLFISSSFDGRISIIDSYTGVLRSTDNGATWIPTGLTLTWNQAQGWQGGTYGVTITSSGHLFASGGDIMRSTDNGVTWTKVEGEINGAWTTITSWKSYVFAANGLTTVVRSTDDGNTWAEAGSLSGVSQIWALAADSSGNIFVGTNQGTYTSTDYGAHWSGGGAVSVTSITVNPANSYVFVGTRTNGIYRSTNHGVSWTNVGFGHSWVGCLYADQRGNVYCRNGSAYYRSTDNGTSWQQIFSADYAYSFIESPSGILIVGVDGGVYRSTDNGTTWLNPPSLTGAWVTSLIKGSDSTLLAGTLGNYIFQTTDDGNSWSQQVIPGLTNGQVICLAAMPTSNLIAGTDGGGIYSSTDQGQIWHSSSNGLDTNLYVFSISVEPNGTIVAGCNPSAATSGGIYSSTNGGTQWTLLTSTTGNVYSTAVLPDGHIFAGTNDGELYVSTDNGITWRDTLLSTTLIRCLIPTQAGYLLAGTDYPGGLYRSTDHGASWTELPFNSAVSFTCGVTDSTAGTFVGTWGQGTYRSTDNGSSWTQVIDGLTDLNVLSLAFDAAGHLYAGTQSSGVFKSSSSLTAVKENPSTVPSTFVLNQNYPNPFNPTTTINFDLKETSTVHLTIFNVLGQRVKEFELGRMSAGTYSQVVDMSRFASGVYFYRIEAVGSDGERYVAMKKMLELK